MKVLVYGASGNSGSRIVDELLRRGHQVTAVARNLSQWPATVAQRLDDLSKVETIAAIIAGAEVVVSAYRAPTDAPDALIGVTQRLIAAVEGNGNTRLLVVGNTAVLELAPGVSLFAAGRVPAAWMVFAAAHARALSLLDASAINWTYFSPAADFVPGLRTGKFRIGGKAFSAEAGGESRISFEDYAVALVDEIELPAHERQVCSIAY